MDKQKQPTVSDSTEPRCSNGEPVDSISQPTTTRVGTLTTGKTTQKLNLTPVKKQRSSVLAKYLKQQNELHEHRELKYGIVYDDWKVKKWRDAMHEAMDKEQIERRKLKLKLRNAKGVDGGGVDG